MVLNREGEVMNRKRERSVRERLHKETLGTRHSRAWQWVVDNGM